MPDVDKVANGLSDVVAHSETGGVGVVDDVTEVVAVEHSVSVPAPVTEGEAVTEPEEEDEPVTDTEAVMKPDSVFVALPENEFVGRADLDTVAEYEESTDKVTFIEVVDRGESERMPEADGTDEIVSDPDADGELVEDGQLLGEPEAVSVTVPEIEIVCLDVRIGVKLPVCDADIENVALDVNDGEIVSKPVADDDRVYPGVSEFVTVVVTDAVVVPEPTIVPVELVDPEVDGVVVPTFEIVADNVELTLSVSECDEDGEPEDDGELSDVSDTLGDEDSEFVTVTDSEPVGRTVLEDVPKADEDDDNEPTPETVWLAELDELSVPIADSEVIGDSEDDSELIDDREASGELDVVGVTLPICETDIVTVALGVYDDEAVAQPVAEDDAVCDELAEVEALAVDVKVCAREPVEETELLVEPEGVMKVVNEGDKEGDPEDDGVPVADPVALGDLDIELDAVPDEEFVACIDLDGVALPHCDRDTEKVLLDVCESDLVLQPVAEEDEEKEKLPELEVVAVTDAVDALVPLELSVEFDEADDVSDVVCVGVTDDELVTEDVTVDEPVKLGDRDVVLVTEPEIELVSCIDLDEVVRPDCETEMEKVTLAVCESEMVSQLVAEDDVEKVTLPELEEVAFPVTVGALDPLDDGEASDDADDVSECVPFGVGDDEPVDEGDPVDEAVLL